MYVNGTEIIHLKKLICELLAAVLPIIPTELRASKNLGCLEKKILASFFHGFASFLHHFASFASYFGHLHHFFAIFACMTLQINIVFGE